MKKLLVGAVAAAVMVPAGNVSADGYSICAPGAATSYFACASATVSFEGNMLKLRVRNWGLLDTGTGQFLSDYGYAITGIGILSSNIPDTGVGLAGVDGSNAGIFGTVPANAWTFTKSLTSMNVDAGAATSGTSDGAIWSKWGTPGGNSGYITDAGQYVEFSFSGITPFTVTGVTFAMRGQSGYPYMDGGQIELDSYRCSDDPTETSAQDCLWEGGFTDSTVPEPMSMILLGSGLLGLAGVRARRRKQG